MGKSVLAAAFARAINTRRAMGDGIVWLTAGPEATKDTVLANLKAVGTTFGDDVAHTSTSRPHADISHRCWPRRPA